MDPIRPNIVEIKKEVQVSTARSGGAGGQHVNKVETKVLLKWDIKNSQVLNESQKSLLLNKLNKKITGEGLLIITAQSERSQLKNKELAFKKLLQMIDKCFLQKKKRIDTKPTRASKLKRLQSKRLHSEKKAMRKRYE